MEGEQRPNNQSPIASYWPVGYCFCSLMKRSCSDSPSSVPVFPCCLVEYVGIYFLSRSWSYYATNKVSFAPMWTTATPTATCTTAAPVPGSSGPLNCCTGTVWTPCVRATTSAMWLWGARSRRRWVSSHWAVEQGQEKRRIYSDVFICPGY